MLAPASSLAVFGDDAETEPVLTEIVIEGNTKTSSAVIRREIDARLGDRLDPDRIDAIWDHLEDIGYFAFVDVDYNDSDPDGAVLTVTVEEDRTTSYGPYIKYDRRHKYLLGGWIEDNNLLGRGEFLRVVAAVYRIPRMQVDWRHPWLFGRRGLSLEMRGNVEGGPFVYRPTHYTEWNLDLAVRWQFHGPLFVEVEGGYYFFDQQHDFDGYTPDRGPDEPPVFTTFPAQQRPAWVYGATLGLDSRNNPYYPTRGTLESIRIRRFDGRENFSSFTELTGDVRLFVPTPWKHIVALRAWGRTIDGPSPREHWLYFGGPETIRGQRWASREGERGYLLTFEYRWPMFLMPISPQGELVGFGLHFFADAGDAWFYGAEAGRAMQSYGLGAHLNLVTWQFRFEAARTREGDTRFEFFDVFNF